MYKVSSKLARYVYASTTWAVEIAEENYRTYLNFTTNIATKYCGEIYKRNL